MLNISGCQTAWNKEKLYFCGSIPPGMDTKAK